MTGIDTQLGGCIVSKMCPSSEAASLPTPPSAQWHGKVFHNTYTWKGRTAAVRGWSVKLQYQGRRRTFSLGAPTQEGAIAEAERIYARLLNEGWDFVDKQIGHRSVHEFDKTDVGYWRKRLVIRKNYMGRTPAGNSPFSVFIDHAGSGYYFPLGLADSDSAAARALTIYQTVRNQGWMAACQIFPREICITFHWASQPLLWTYTTVLTLPQGYTQPAQTAAKASAQQYFLVVEADPSIRSVLASLLSSLEGWQCIFKTDIDTLRSQRPASFCLINADQQGKTCLPAPSHLALLPNGIPAIAYAIHANSDAAFTAPPGGISSYFYKRLPPHDMLEPIQAALKGATVSLPALKSAAQAYLRSSLKMAIEFDPSSAHVLLTPREQQVFDYLCKGNVDKEIATALDISPWTVRSHLKHIFEKLKVHSRIEAMLWDGVK